MFELILIFLGFIAFLALAITFLKLFDRIAGRGPGQVSKGMKEYDQQK